jgi:kumamolisin
LPLNLVFLGVNRISMVETIGSLAPKARFRIYSAPNTTAGYLDALKHAVADHVSVLATNWGRPESSWKSEDIRMINDALESAALQGITVIAAAGDLGVTDGLHDGHKHVDFPGSSPWVLSVGGTTLKTDAGGNKSETAWKDPAGTFATGGGVSEKFLRPDWQSAVQVPRREDGNPGRGIPDVVASADYVPIRVHGQTMSVGGTGLAVGHWAASIALINQALGHNVGYLNPLLYREIGPAGVLRAITSGDNGVGGIKGYDAGLGWSPVAGWGSPDLTRLVTWFSKHPDSRAVPTAMPRSACRSDGS